MSDGPDRAGADLRWLSEAPGLPCEVLRERLGEPAAEREAGGGRWFLYRWPGITLRVRGGAGARGRIAAWTAALEDGGRSLSEAADPFGLWPACAPDAAAGSAPPLLRRAVRPPGGGPARSLTATVREGRITALTLFDEEPDWE